MERDTIVRVIQAMGNATVEELPNILEPFTKYGKSIQSVIKIVREGLRNAKNLEEKMQVCKTAKEQLLELNAQYGPPNYMNSVLYICKDGVFLTTPRQEKLKQILQQELQSDDERSCLLIAEFIRQYMGGEIDVESIDECSIGNDYLSFYFFDDGVNEYPYDEEALKLIMEAINSLMEEEIFDNYVSDGHMESYEEE